MAMTSGGGSGSRSYSYRVTETYTLEDAVKKASSGSLDVEEVYKQMPKELQSGVDRIAFHKYGKKLSNLDWDQQQTVMGILANEIEQAKETQENPLSIFDSIHMAADGKIDDLKLYDILPEELRNIIDALATANNISDFKKANSKMRRQILEFVLEIFNADAPGNDDAVNVDEGKKSAQEKNEQKAGEIAKPKTGSEAKQKMDEMAKNQRIIEIDRKKEGLCISCGKSLGFFNRLIGRERHPGCLA
jgi:hypothetical protein